MQRLPLARRPRLYDDFGQRLPDLDRALRSRRAAHAADLHRQLGAVNYILVDQTLVRYREQRQMNAFRRILINRPHEVLVHLFGNKGREGRKQFCQRYQGLVEGIIGGELVVVVLALPETPPAPVVASNGICSKSSEQEAGLDSCRVGRGSNLLNLPLQTNQKRVPGCSRSFDDDDADWP